MPVSVELTVPLIRPVEELIVKPDGRVPLMLQDETLPSALH